MRILPLVFAFICATGFAQVGINTAEPHPAAALDISASNSPGGLILPTVTIAQRDLIVAGADDAGLMVFVEDGSINSYQVWDGTAWRLLGGLAVNQAPIASNVAITGFPQVGNTLSGSYDYSDADGDAESGSSFVWITYDDASGTNPTQVATTQSYTAQAADQGRFIRFGVTPAAADGVSPGAQVFSAYEGPISAASTGGGGVIISELADPNNNANARFVELTNTSSSTIDIGDWVVNKYTNAGTAVDNSFTIPAGTLITAGESLVFSNNATEFQTVYGFAPDFAETDPNGTFGGNGDDDVELVDDNGTTIDFYGVFTGSNPDNTGTCAEFEDGRALRNASVTEPNPVFDESEWSVWADSTVSGCTSHMNSPRTAPADFTPGTHPN